MKKLLLLATILLPMVIFAQEWTKNLPQKENKQLSFFEIQKVFNDYYAPLNVENGKRIENGKIIKVPGWKQFKRWEWFWEQRVNPTTGAFPNSEALNRIMSQNYQAKTKSKGGNWTSVGPTESLGGYAGLGRINCIAFHPSDTNTYWVGSPSGGLWKTTNGGVTWSVLTDNNAVLGVSDIAIPSDYETSKTIYIATGDKDGGSMRSLGGGGYNDNNSIGVLKSTDGGVTWSAIGLTFNVSDGEKIGRLLIHPTNNNILFVGTTKGIYKTTDGGANWTHVYSGNYVIDMEFKPGSPDVIYASQRYYSPKILKSTNTGDSWLTIKTFSSSDKRIELAVTPDAPDYIYAIVAKSNSGLRGIFKSIDGGANFTQLVNGNDDNKAYLYYFSDGSGENKGQGNYDLCIAASPKNKDIVLIGGVNTWITKDGGNAWENCNMWTSHNYYNKDNSPVAHADKHCLKFSSSGSVFETNDGGAYKSIDNGDSWNFISSGMAISQIYRLGVSQTAPGMYITGLQDNGSKARDNNDGVWYDVTGGDGMECIIDFTDENTQYSTYARGRIYRTTNMWEDYTTISNNINGGSEVGAWVTPYILDHNNHKTIYVGYSDVWKSTTRGNYFTKISTMNTSSKIRSMAVSKSNSDYLYVADFDNIWKTTNGGTSWTDITGTLPVFDNNITYIAVKSNDPNTVWVTMGGYDNKNVYQTVDGGATWIDISAGLPELPVMTIVQNIQITSDVHLYAGTDVGVYFKKGNDNWVLFSEGLPNVVVTELEIYYDNNDKSKSKLVAATYGRGVWVSDLYPDAQRPTALFKASNTSIQETAGVKFTDMSTDIPDSWSWTFEGGTPATSTEQNPTVTYATQGIFDVTLVVSNAMGKDTLLKADYITVNQLEKPVAGFSTISTNVYTGQNVLFTDTSLNFPDNWKWDFTGGTPATSTEQNPTVVYSSTGTFDVRLIASNNAGKDTLLEAGYIKVNDISSFPEPVNVMAKAVKNYVTLTWEMPFIGTISVNKFKIYRNNQEIITIDSTKLSYVDTNLQAGDYTYYITAVYAYPAGTSANSNEAPVTVYGEAKANFMADNVTGAYPLTVTFTNNSENADSYDWDFGDGSTSVEVSPVHIYSERGTYTVSLTAMNNENADTEAKNNYIKTTEKELTVDFTADVIEGVYPLTVTFTNNSENADSYSWDFGDGNTSTEVNPEHTYSNIGSYTVKLTASNADFTETKVKANYIMVKSPDPIADFEANPTTGIDPLIVTFTDKSQYAQTWSWDFGDNLTSNAQNPQHTFTKGTYTITLLVTNSSGNDSEIKENLIVVEPNSIIENTDFNLKVYPNPAHNQISVELINENFKKVNFKLYDTNGKLIKNIIPELSSTIRKQININELKSGNYILKVVIDNSIIVVNIVKQ